MGKRILVDLDDTLISYSEMFVNRCNVFLTQNMLIQKYISHIKLNIDDIKTYNYIDAFKEKFGKFRGISYSALYQQYCLDIYKDENFYDYPIYTTEYYDIMERLKKYSTNDKIILHTKVSSYNMSKSKIKLFEKNKDFDIFDEIIIDMERGEHSPKQFIGDVLIDDSPLNIENFLNNNPNGKVLLPIRPWNKQFLNNERVEGICI